MEKIKQMRSLESFQAEAEVLSGLLGKEKRKTKLAEDDYISDVLPNWEEKRFIAGFIDTQKFVHRTAKRKGWWDTERNDGEMIALIHSELSEGLEALRHGNPPDDKIPEFSGIEAELADVVVRIMDMSQARGWRIAEAIVAKLKYNETREHKHGKHF